MRSVYFVASRAPFDVVEDAFKRLSDREAYLLDSRQIGCSLRAPLISLDELRDRLRHADHTVRDAAIGSLVVRARDDAGWRLAVVGLLLPGLRKAARKLAAPSFPGDRRDLEAELIAGLLIAVARDSGRPPKVAARLVWAAFRHGWKLKQREGLELRHRARHYQFRDSLPAQPRPVHPDELLVAAIQAGVLRPWEAELIAASRVERISLAVVAARWALPYDAARMRRHRAEVRLANWLVRTGQVGPPSLKALPSPSSTRRRSTAREVG